MSHSDLHVFTVGKQEVRLYAKQVLFLTSLKMKLLKSEILLQSEAAPGHITTQS